MRISLFLIISWTGAGLQYRGLFCGYCKYAQVYKIDWRKYPSDLNSNSLTIEIGNQPGKGISPTHSIRELLKEAGYRWSPSQQIWLKSVDKETYEDMSMQQEEWFAKADGIVINVYDTDRKLVDTFLV